MTNEQRISAFIARHSQSAGRPHDTSRRSTGIDESPKGAGTEPQASTRLSAIPRRLALALPLHGTGLLATIPFLFKATSLTTAFFSAVAMPCFAAGFLIYTVAVIRDLHENGVF